MKYKLLLIAICITIITTETKPTNEGSVLRQQRSNELNPELKLENKRLNKGRGLRSRIRVDKSGNRWAFDDNSREWMHLPKQQTNPLTSTQNSGLLGQPLPDIFPSLPNQKGQQTGQKINSPSIYGPHFPSNTFKPIERPNDNYEFGYGDKIPINGPVFGPLPLPGAFEPSDEEEFNDMEDVMTWQNVNNFSNNFPIPGGPNYPNPLDKPNSGYAVTQKPVTQSPVRIGSKDKPNANTLEEFEDPFETQTKSTNKPTNDKKNSRMSTTTRTYEDYDDTLQTLPPAFEPSLIDEDIDLEPIIPIGNEIGLIQGSQGGQRERQRSTKKPNRKPIIKIPIGPPEQPILWTIFDLRTTTATTPTTTESLQQNNQNNNSSDVIELYPPVPPEQPGNVPTEQPKTSTVITEKTSSDAIEENNKPKEIFMTTEETMSTAKEGTTQIPFSSSVPSIESSTQKVDPSATTTAPINSGQPIAATTVDPWKPITLGKRHQTPVPIIQYPTIPPSEQEIWRPVMGPYSPIKVQSSQLTDSNWVRPTMGSMSGNIIDIMSITTRKVYTLTSTTTTTPTPSTITTTTTTVSPTVYKRKVIKKKIIKTTTEATTTTMKTTESPKRVVTKKIIKRLKTTTTTTTERPTTVSTTLATTRRKKVIKKTPKTTTTTEAPTETTEEDIYEESDDNIVSEPITAVSEETEELDEPKNNDIKEQTSEPIEKENAEEEELEELPGPELNEDENDDKDTNVEPIPDIKDNSEENINEVEEEVEEISPETNPETDHKENEVSKSDEVIEVEEEEVPEQENNQPSEKPIEEIYVEEEEEVPLEESGSQNIKEDPKEGNGGQKEDNNKEEEVIEYEYEEVTEEPLTDSNEIEEIIYEYEDENPETEQTTKEVSTESDEKWQHVVIPMRRKGPPNLFPRRET